MVTPSGFAQASKMGGISDLIQCSVFSLQSSVGSLFLIYFHQSLRSYPISKRLFHAVLAAIRSVSLRSLPAEVAAKEGDARCTTR